MFPTDSHARVCARGHTALARFPLCEHGGSDLAGRGEAHPVAQLQGAPFTQKAVQRNWLHQGGVGGSP